MTNDTFKALAHPLRRDIVERLSGGVATVGEVTRDSGVSKPTISRHLKLLEEAGLVSRVVEAGSTAWLCGRRALPRPRIG